ncbi:MAG: hypothetical protein M3N98_15805 [Actinomycetota bacterium]|nr:hypothetical protein [Actinomycetota bacterium]
MTWTGARALTGQENAPSGAATDGTRVVFTTDRFEGADNAVRAVSLDGPPVSQLLVKRPAGRNVNARVALDGDVAYVASGRGIVQVPLDGGPATVVVDNRPAGIDEVVVAGDQLWWTTEQYRPGPDWIEVARAPKAGGPVEVVTNKVGVRLNDLHPEGDSALVVAEKGVLRVRAGSPAEIVVSNESVGGGQIAGLAMDSQRYYLLMNAAKHGVLAVPRAGGPPVVLADEADNTKKLVVVGDQVVFFASGGSFKSPRTLLQAVPAAGGPVRTIASGGLSQYDLAALGNDRVVFSGDDQVWVASVRS